MQALLEPALAQVSGEQGERGCEEEEEDGRGERGCVEDRGVALYMEFQWISRVCDSH